MVLAGCQLCGADELQVLPAVPGVHFHCNRGCHCLLVTTHAHLLLREASWQVGLGCSDLCS